MSERRYGISDMTRGASGAVDADGAAEAREPRGRRGANEADGAPAGLDAPEGGGDLAAGNLESALEALLFVSDAPVNVITLAEMAGADPAAVQAALQRLAARRQREGAGVLLREVAGGWRLYTNPAHHELLERYVLSWDTRRLTQAALETLAIVAYAQPITRLGIAAIRGVNSDSSVSSLIDKGLVREAGQADSPGYPMTYATTRAFLEKFGLRNVGELPPLEQFAPDGETLRLLRAGLSAHGQVELRDNAADADGAGSPTPDDGAAGLYADGAPGVSGIPEAGEAGTPVETAGQAAARAMREAVAQAIARSAGLVEKIDFDELEFEE